MARRIARFIVSPLCQQPLLFTLLLTLLVRPSAFASGAEMAKDEATKKILIFSSYDSTLPGFTIGNEAMRATFRKDSSVRIQFYREALDNYEIFGSKYEERIVSLLRQKYEGENVDLILALGAPALKILLKHRANLLPDTPIVFCLLDQADESAHRLGPDATGIWAKPEYSKILQTALALHPETEKVAVVAGNSQLDRSLLEGARQEFRNYEGRVEF